MNVRRATEATKIEPGGGTGNKCLPQLVFILGILGGSTGSNTPKRRWLVAPVHRPY